MAFGICPGTRGWVFGWLGMWGLIGPGETGYRWVGETGFHSTEGWDLGGPGSWDWDRVLMDIGKRKTLNITSYQSQLSDFEFYYDPEKWLGGGVKLHSKA